MKEIVGYRLKGQFTLFFVASFISMCGSIAGTLLVPKLRFFYLSCAIVWGLIALMGAIGLCFPKWVIAKEGNYLLVHNGFRSFKTIKIALRNVIAVKACNVFDEKKQGQYGNIVLTFKTADGTRDMLVTHVKNVQEVAEKIKSFIAERADGNE